MSVPTQQPTSPDEPHAWLDDEAPDELEAQQADEDAEETGPAAAFERVPPQDIAAERSVLGGMLLSKEAIADVIAVMRLHDHYRPAHELIHGVIIDMYSRGEPADPITVADELTKRGELQRAGGPSYLHTLVNIVPTAANAEYYAEIVHERAVLRRLVEAGTRITGMGYACEGEVHQIVQAAHTELAAVEEARAEEQAVRVRDGIERTIEMMAAIEGRGDELTGVPTGFADLDKLTNGLQGGQFVIVAARPALGKSTLALDFLRAASIGHDLPSVIFSLEMGQSEIHMRLLSAEARVALHHIRTGTMTKDDWERVCLRMPAITEAPLFIDDSPNLSMMDIRAKARRLKQRNDIKLIVIDYLQLMQPGGSRRAENRQQDVSDMSRNLKLLAKELDLPIVALSQLNRGPEQREDHTPRTSDLRESGSLEQDADMVILLHREDAYEKESPRAGEADLIVAKHRNGPTCTVTVAFQGHYSRFVDMSRD